MRGLGEEQARFLAIRIDRTVETADGNERLTWKGVGHGSLLFSLSCRSCPRRRCTAQFCNPHTAGGHAGLSRTSTVRPSGTCRTDGTVPTWRQESYTRGAVVLAVLVASRRSRASSRAGLAEGAARPFRLAVHR